MLLRRFFGLRPQFSLIPIVLSLPTAVVFVTLVSITSKVDGAPRSLALPAYGGPPDIILLPYATVNFSPVDIASSGLTGDDRLFVVEQNGIVRIVDSGGVVVATPFLNIIDRVDGGSEMGLLGLVFDPEYGQNGYFYVNYTEIVAEGEEPGIYTRISRFSVTADPDVADPNSEFLIFTIRQPFANHNAGDLNFGPDGYFYFGLGDGGSGGDPGNRAQNPQNLLGKMIRIDVSGTTSTTNYLIPPDNPFVGDPNTLNEIWALGLRNPWRFSFDGVTGDMYIGDVGQNAWEEIDFQPVTSGGGENWGWRCYEGNAPFETTGCNAPSTYDFPIHVYENLGFPDECAVSGGYVYRGSHYPTLDGLYFFADYCSGDIWSLDTNNGWQLVTEDTFNNELFTTFGENHDGELFVASTSSNRIFQIAERAELIESTSFMPFVAR